MGLRYSKQRHKPRISKSQIPWLLRGAIRSNNMETLQYLFSYPNKVDPSMVIDGVCPLNLAVELGHLQMVKILIKAGADINVADAPRYPLHQASISGRAPVVELLIRSGASVTALTERRQSCLHLLCQQSAERFVDTAHALMRHGINPNSLDDDGLAPVHRASVEMIRVLASYEVSDLNICSRNGDTPLLTAVKDRREAVVYALLNVDQQYREQQQQLALLQQQQQQQSHCNPPPLDPSGDDDVATTLPPLSDHCCTTVRTCSAKSAPNSAASRLTLASATSTVFRNANGGCGIAVADNNTMSTLGAGLRVSSSAASVQINSSSTTHDHNITVDRPTSGALMVLRPAESVDAGATRRRITDVHHTTPVAESGSPDVPGGGVDSGGLWLFRLTRSSAKHSRSTTGKASCSHTGSVLGAMGVGGHATHHRGSTNVPFGTYRQSENCQRCHSVGNPSDVSGWWQSCDRLQRLLTKAASSVHASNGTMSTIATSNTRQSAQIPCPTPVTLRARLDLDKPDKIDMSALMIATEAGNSGLGMTVALVNAGCNVSATDKVGMTALHHACYVGALQVVRFLLERVSSIHTAQSFAAATAAGVTGSTPSATVSVEQCDSPRQYTSGPVMIPELLNLQDKYGRTPIYLAACRGHTEVVNYLLAQSADFHVPNKEHKSPLYISAYFGYLEIAMALLRHSAQVDQLDSHRKTPLYVATYHGRTEIVDLLLAAGASVNSADKNGKTPLYIAVLHGHLALARKLLHAGASVNRVDREGLGPLHMAVKFPKLDIPMVKLLLQYGCDPVNLASFTRWLLMHGIIPQECIHGDDELARWLHREECNVRSLRRLCRAAIQRAVGNTDSMRGRLRRLPLPEHLLSYVSMKEL